MDQNVKYTDPVINITVGNLKVSFADANEPRSFDKPIRHFHSSYELQYVVKGALCLRTNDKTFIVKAGEYVLVPEGCFHWSEPSVDIERYAVLFTLSCIGSEGANNSEYDRYSSIFSSLSGPVVLSCTDLDFYVAKLRSLPINSTESHVVKHLFMGVFISLSLNLPSENEFLASANSKSAFRRRSSLEVRGTIDDALTMLYNENGLLGKISDMLHTSRRNTARIVNEIYGCSLSELIARHRMNCALSLITNTNDPLTEVASNVGYNTYSAFYKAFKKYYGKSPEMYRM